MKKKKIVIYLYLLPIIICLGFVIYFYQLNQYTAQERHIRIFDSRKRLLDLTASEINYFLQDDHDWEKERDFYIDWLLFSRDFINVQELTTSVLMDQDFNLIDNELHSTEAPQYNLFLSQYFISNVNMTGSGEISLTFNGQEVSVYYIWIPEHQDEQILFAVSLIQDASRNLNNVYIPAIAGLVIFVLTVNYIMLWTILKRNGDQHAE